MINVTLTLRGAMGNYANLSFVNMDFSLNSSVYRGLI